MTGPGISGPGDLAGYLARRGFAPHASNGTWLDRATGTGTVRVVCEPEEQTRLICLDRHGVCRYQAAFSPGTPGAVITAAAEAALALIPGGTGPAVHARKKGGSPR